MVDYTRPATWEDVKQLARLLNDAGTEYALVGAYALAAHGIHRFSEDVDVLVNPSAANSRRWILALSRLPDGATRELLEAPDVFATNARYAVRVNDEITIDIMPSVGGQTWEEMRKHIQVLDIDGIAVPVLDIEGLLLTKQGDRPKDQMDASVLRQLLADRARDK